MTVYVNGEGQNTTNSAGIVDGSIVNADINSSAAIAASKISGTALVASTADAKGDLYVASAADTVGRLAVGANGTVPTANSGDTAGIGYAYPADGVPAVYRAAGTTAKAMTMDPMRADTTVTMVDGTFYLQAIYLPFDATLTGVAFGLSVQGDTTADNENRLGLYTSDGTTLTLVASCADDGTLWEATAGQVSKAFSSTYAAQAGVYWIGLLANWSAVATAPTLLRDAGGSPGGSFLLPGDVKSAGTVVTQATLPATQAWSGVTVVNHCILLGLY